MADGIIGKILIDKSIYKSVILLNLLMLVAFYVVVVFSSSQDILNGLDVESHRIVKSKLSIVVFILVILSIPALFLSVFIISKFIKWYLNLWQIVIDYKVIKGTVNFFLLVNISLLLLYFGFIGVNGIIDNFLYQMMLPCIQLLIFIMFWIIMLNLYNIRLKKLFLSITPLLPSVIIVQIVIYVLT